MSAELLRFERHSPQQIRNIPQPLIFATVVDTARDKIPATDRTSVKQLPPLPAGFQIHLRVTKPDAAHFGAHVGDVVGAFNATIRTRTDGLPDRQPALMGCRTGWQAGAVSNLFGALGRVR
jgi:hypothetical protein